MDGWVTKKDKRLVKGKKDPHAKHGAWNASALPQGGAGAGGAPCGTAHRGFQQHRPHSAPALAKEGKAAHTQLPQHHPPPAEAYRPSAGEAGASPPRAAPPPRPKVHFVGGGGAKSQAKWQEVPGEDAGVTKLEMVTGGVGKTGVLRLAPHSVMPVRTDAHHSLVLIVTKGKANLLEEDGKRKGQQLRPGECVVTPPATRCSIAAGDAECECFYAQEVYAAAAARAADGVFEAVDDVAFEQVRDVQRGHKDYVQSFRSELQRCQQYELYSDSSIRGMMAHYKQEATARGELISAEAIEYEAVTRGILGRLENAEWGCVHAARRAATYLPWCSMGCRYCCKLQHELYSQLNDIALRETELLIATEEQATRAVLSDEEIAWKDLTTTAWCAQLQLCVFTSGRQQMWRKAKAAKLLIQLEEKRAALDLSHAMHLSHENARFNDDSWALKKQHIELCRFSDLLSLREGQLHNEQLNSLERMETNKRECLEESEDDARTCLASEMEKQHTILLASNAEARVRMYREQVEALEKYKREREADDAEKARLLFEEEQATLAAEMDAIRARKGKGKNKPKVVIPESVAKTELCDRCGNKVGKSNYAKHIDTECPMRPTECKLCGMLVRVKDVTEHVASTCQAREEECPQCGELYQARSVPVHLGWCSRLQHAKEVLPTLKPDLGIEVEEADEGLRIKAIKKETALEGVADVDDVILFVNERAVHTLEKYASIVELLSPGQEITITLKAKKNAGGRGGPWWGGEDAADMQHTVLTIIVETSIPLEEFHEMNDLMAEDSGLRSPILSPTSDRSRMVLQSDGGFSATSRGAAQQQQRRSRRAASSAGSRTG